MRKSWLTLACVLGALLLGLISTLPVHFGYYADYNAVLGEIGKHAELEVIDGWRNEDITLEEFGFVIRSPQTTLLVNFSERGPRRPEDIADGIAIPTNASREVGTVSYTVYSYIRFDSEDWKSRGLPRVRTLADVFAHYDTIAHNLIAQPPIARIPLGTIAENAVYFNRPFASPSGRPPPKLLSVTDNSMLKELLEKLTR